MKLVLLAFMLAACGRANFDPVVNGDGSPGDGQPVDVLPSGSLVFTQQQQGLLSELYELDTATGGVSLLGKIDPAIGEVDGIARLTTTTLLAVSMNGTIAELGLDGSVLRYAVQPGAAFAGLGGGPGQYFAITEDTDKLYEIHPLDLTATLVGPVTANATAVDIKGGDLAYDPDARSWWLITNASNVFYSLDVSTAKVSPNQAFQAGDITGVIVRDSMFYMLSRMTDELVQHYTVDFDLYQTTQLCGPCPTLFDLQYGDLAEL